MGGVVEWWSGGVVEWWSGGVVEWWSDALLEVRLRERGLESAAGGRRGAVVLRNRNAVRP
jgi:hypothetical protein